MTPASNIPRIIQVLRTIVPWKSPEIMCLLLVGTLVLGLPAALIFKYYTNEDIPPQQHGIGRIISVWPAPNEMVNFPTVLVNVEMCGRGFSQSTVIGAHLHLKAGMLVPLVFLLRHSHGEPSEMEADFSLTRDMSLNQADVATCSQFRKPSS